MGSGATEAARGSLPVLLVVLLASYGLVYFHRAMTGIMEPELTAISRRHGYDPLSYLALISSAYFYAYSLSQFLVGPLIDYYGIRRACASLLVLLGVGAALMARAEPATMVLGRALVGFSSSAAFLSYQRALSLYLRREEQARLVSIALVVGNLSAALSTFPLRLALDSVGVPGVSAALALAALALAAATLAAAPEETGRGPVGYFAATREGLLRVVKDGHSWGVSIGALATYGTALSFQSSWGQLLLSEAFRLDRAGVSAHLLLFTSVFTAVAPVFGYASDKVLRRRKPLLLASSASMAVSWGLLAAAAASGSTTLLRVSLVVLGITLGPHVVASVMVREAYEVSVAATSVAFLNTVLFLGTATLNSVLPRVGHVTALGTSALLSVLGAAAVACLCRETYHSSQPKARAPRA